MWQIGTYGELAIVIDPFAVEEWIHLHAQPVGAIETMQAPPGCQQGGVTHRRPMIPCLSRMTSKSEGY